ncbi:uncharacterized protein F4822DRAFT_375374 [Hypoxylon trugodes]|uniref:uncharacterized protein n=1 Tax=Hypoxylon trugodes TaxID=326681 RepID=UPI0021903E58|nr:uncharacterized protein F4822DRAFT_375374 [Hypoxylon trugodes]KAI1384868.1 hypothetical protein F4822DRAFT_375374 [Hypoxylon trugodes]
MPPPIPVGCTRAYSSSSAAKVLVRLLCASSAHPSISSSGPILDVLLPPRTRFRGFHVASPRDSREPVTFRARSKPSRPQNHASTAAINAVKKQRFSATAHWRRTQAVYNPQKDEDGNDMLLEITPRAANRLSQIMAKDENPNLALRISVESGGCHGFQYLMSLTTLPPSLPSAPPTSSSPVDNPHHPPPEISTSPPHPAGSSAESSKTAAKVAPSTTTSVSEDDTIFAFIADPSSSPDQPPTPAQPSLPKIILDGPSLELLKGSKVDFAMELIGSQFKIVDNPLATSSCGCGTSFDIKL